MKCKDCGKYQAMSWGKGYCLRCWFTTDDPPPANVELELLDLDGRYESCGCHFAQCRNVKEPQKGLSDVCGLFNPHRKDGAS